MAKYQYRTAILSNPGVAGLDRHLTSWADAGWELVTVTSTTWLNVNIWNVDYTLFWRAEPRTSEESKKADRPGSS